MAFLNSAPDWIVIAILVLLIFGPNKVPELGRQLGRAMREFRKVADEFTGATASIRAEVSHATDTLRSEFASIAPPAGLSRNGRLPEQRPYPPAPAPLDQPPPAGLPVRIATGLSAETPGAGGPPAAAGEGARSGARLRLSSLPSDDAATEE